jgi:hypothetical protein
LRKWTARQQQTWLRRLKTQVNANLAAEGFSILAKPDWDIVQPTYWTDGWYVDFGRLRVAGLRQVSAFLDTATRAPSPRLWTGIFAASERMARGLARTIARHTGPFNVLRPRDFAEVDESEGEPVTQMVRPLPPDAFNRPTLELLSQGYSAFGVYWSDTPNYGKAPSASLIRKVSAFLSEAIACLENSSAPHGRSYDGKPDAPFWNRKVIVTGKAYRRSSRQARLTKERDKYTCQVCGVRPEERYGWTGRAVLEAHHVRRLAGPSATERHTTLSDLITVCANCHRVLGKLPADERGLEQLRKRFM